MLDEVEIRMIKQGTDIVEVAGQEIIDADDPVSFLNEAIAQIRADKASSPGNYNVHFGGVGHCNLLYFHSLHACACSAVSLPNSPYGKIKRRLLF
jgi:hypothetical protein